MLGEEGIYIYTRERFPKNETFELSDKKLFSTIEKEFSRLFGQSNSTSKIQPMNITTNMTRVS